MPLNAWYRVEWDGHVLDVVVATWKADFGEERWSWIVAETMDVASNFFDAVCAHCFLLREEVLVFREGCWRKSARLYNAVQGTTLDSLVLAPGLADDIHSDCKQFFESREAYALHKLPWKRGLLLLGAPGNGKTHCVKGLVNVFDKPCLYVQSFKSDYGTEQQNVETVFRRARHTTPCILVLEDLDSLLNDENRSFFLNELDGFEENEGILTIATTNFPERLDPSIIERPSRFDRKYTFELPAIEERRRYLQLWNTGLEEALRIDDDMVEKIAALTDGFSFAYLKELCISAFLKWFHSRDTALGELMLQQSQKLRAQMSTKSAKGAKTPQSPAS